jgi:hypothetical protein
MKQCDLTLVIAFSLGLCGVAISSAQEPPTGTVEHREIQKLEFMSPARPAVSPI